jgi:4-azaleucine resistance transporter AzlC
MKNNRDIIRYSITKSLPVLFGYVFLGIAYGIMLQQAGYGVLWAFLSSLLCYAGSAQFAIASMVGVKESISIIGLTTLFINARHVFYGISFVDEFKNMKQRLYMIFSLSDETYSVFGLCQKDEQLHRDNNKPMFYIALFDHCYWIAGSVIGALAGQFIPFDFTGIDFSMTALFVVILVDRLRGGKEDKSSMLAAVVGLAAGAVCLVVFGTNKFLLPAILITVLALTIQTQIKKEESRA